MSNNVINLNNHFYIPIKNKNNYSYSDFNKIQYIFTLELILLDKPNILIKNSEDINYSHLIKLINDIKLNDIKCYNVSITILNNNMELNYELTGNILHSQTSSIEYNNNVYIEFTQNNHGVALCTCYYTGLNYNKLFVSPPN